MKAYLETVEQRGKAGFLKSWFLKLVFSRIGPVVTAGIASGIGYVISTMVDGLAAIGIPVNAEMQMEVAGFLAFVVYGIINFAVNKYAGDSAAALQEALAKSTGMPIKVDKWIDVETIKVAQAMGAKPKAIPVEE